MPRTPSPIALDLSSIHSRWSENISEVEIVPAGWPRSKNQPGRRTASTVAPRLSSVRAAACQALATSGWTVSGSCFESGSATRMPSIEPPFAASVKSSSGWSSVVGSRGSGAASALSSSAQSSTDARHRADRIERPAQEHRAVQADAPERDLETDQSVERRRDAHRAAGVAADTGRREARGDRHAGAARRAARRAMGLEVPGIPRRAHQRVGAPAAERELDHVQLAEREHAGGRQPLDRVRGLGRDPLLPHLRAAGADAALDVAQVLVGHRQAVQRPERKAAGARGVGRVGHRSRFLGVDLGEGVQLLVRLLDAAEQGVGYVARGELLGGEAGGQLRQGEVVQTAHQ